MRENKKWRQEDTCTHNTLPCQFRAACCCVASKTFLMVKNKGGEAWKGNFHRLEYIMWYFFFFSVCEWIWRSSEWWRKWKLFFDSVSLILLQDKQQIASAFHTFLSFPFLKITNRCLVLFTFFFYISILPSTFFLSSIWNSFNIFQLLLLLFVCLDYMHWTLWKKIREF